MLSELTASTERLALVGLAKNTGKTETLAALLRELRADGRCVGVTSVGRDGEERDVIDSRIEKPRVQLGAGSIVATTDTLLSASGIPHQQLEDTRVRTPLGRVLIARLKGAGTIEVAGPSAAADVRAVSDAMLGHGAEQVLIDGAVDRRAASSPAISDGLVISTGAVLSDDISEVVARTVDAVDLVRLAPVEDSRGSGERLRALAEGGADGASLLVGEDLQPRALPPRFLLSGDAGQIAELLDANPAACWLIVAGALPERFLGDLVHALRRRRRELVLVVADPTRVFLAERGPESYRRQGIRLQTLRPIELQAITVNPVAPQSHRFDSAQLRTMLAEAIPHVPIFDVLDPSYGGPHAAARPERRGSGQRATS
jgi:hypothetical protein